MENNRVKINKASQAETINVHITEDKFPIVFRNKLDELMEQGAFETVEEAKRFIEENLFELELYYEKECGLFGLDPEAVADSKCYSPYTGIEMQEVKEQSPDKEFVKTMLLRIHETMKVIGNEFVAILLNKSYIDKGFGRFYLSEIKWFKTRDVDYHQFIFKNDDGDYGYIDINSEGEYQWEGEKLYDDLNKVMGWKYTTELEVVNAVKEALYDELNSRINKFENVLSSL